MHEVAFNTVENWSKIRHPSIVSVREAFTTRAFNDHCASLYSIIQLGHACSLLLNMNNDFTALVFAHDYHPNAQTLASVHFAPKPPPSARGGGRSHHNQNHNHNHNHNHSHSSGNQQQHLDEQVIWSYISQIATGLKEVHSNNLAVRTLDASKILVSGKNRSVSFLSFPFPIAYFLSPLFSVSFRSVLDPPICLRMRSQDPDKLLWDPGRCLIRPAAKR